MQMPEIVFALRGEFISLDALLKATGMASSGGVAKQMIMAGMVSVDRMIERRRSCKIRPRQTVECAGTTVCVIASALS